MEGSWREVEAIWQGNSIFIGKNHSGGSVQMGSADDKPGISPMELILIGLAGCTGMDVAEILRKKRQPVDAITIKVRGKRVDDHPRIYSDIEIEYLFFGNGIETKAVEQAIDLSERKYCSVSAMLSKAVNITWSYQILMPESDTHLQ
jgi:putative redox protein